MNTETLNANIEKIPSLEEVREEIEKVVKELGDAVKTSDEVFDEKGLAILSVTGLKRKNGSYFVYQYMREGYKHSKMDDASSGGILVIKYDRNGKMIYAEFANQNN